MHRRALRTASTVLVALVTVVLALGAPAGVMSAGASTPGPTELAIPDEGESTVPTTTPERSVPPVTVSDFYPESANLSDCVGFVERPGCGSEARGGLQQTLTFFALAAGLGVIVWRIMVGVRRNRESIEQR